MPSRPAERAIDDGDDVEKDLQDAALLHTLATHPERIVPPGKTLRTGLLSNVQKPEVVKSSAAYKKLEEKVYNAMHKAFWDKATEALKDPRPSVHLPQVEALYHDLAKMFKNVLPRKHPCLLTLTAPLSPTPAALLTARRQLSQLASALSVRCAPIRDENVRKVQELLADERSEGMPERIIEAVEDLTDLSLLMRTDLSRTMLGAASDDKLEVEIVRAAREKERDVISKIFGLKTVCQRWEDWVSDDGLHWTQRLVRALGEDVSVSCPLPTNTEEVKNTIPPVFFFCLFDLVHLQNTIQALVIAATLTQTCVPKKAFSESHSSSLPPSPSHSQVQHHISENATDGIPERAFTERILSLLKSEVDDITSNPALPTQTKLAHLAAECDRERRLKGWPPLHESPSGDRGEIETMQQMVKMVLDPSNAVFQLMRRRVLGALGDAVVKVVEGYVREDTFTGQTKVPLVMRAGRGRPAKRTLKEIDGEELFGVVQNDFDASSDYSRPREVGAMRRFMDEQLKSGSLRLEAKGYEDAMLRRGLEGALGELVDAVEWVRDVWMGFGLKGIDKELGGDGVVEAAPLSSGSAMAVDS